MFIKKIKNQSGQAVLITMGLIGVVLATIVLFGQVKSAQVQKQVNRIENDLIANDLFLIAAKKVQQIYMNEAGCDPDRLNTIINNWSVLPSQYATGLDWAIADASESTTARKQGLCSGGTGCRQMGFELGGRGYIITVAQIDFGSDASTTGGVFDTSGTCSRDTSVNLVIKIEGTVYNRFVTLINLCSLKSCTGPSFEGATATASAALTTTACTNSNGTQIGSRKYGVLLDSTNTNITSDDIRWARRYLATGGADQGVTEFLYTTASPTSGNATCDVSGSASQCKTRSCVPGFDLDMDKSNTDADLAILELYVRGYINVLPITAVR